MAAVRRMSRSSALVVAWSLVSCALALSPVGFGGAPRAVNGVVFLVMAPGFALATFLHRRYTVGTQSLLAPGLVSVICGTFSITLLVLIGMALLLVGAWSVAAVVGIVTAVSVLFAVWPAGQVSAALFLEDEDLALEAAPAATVAALPAAARTGEVAGRTRTRVLPAAPAAGALTTGTPPAEPGTDEVVMWS